MNAEKFDISKMILNGAAYYPEDWDESEQDKDIEMMKKAGIKTVRMAEFVSPKIKSASGLISFISLYEQFIILPTVAPKSSPTASVYTSGSLSFRCLKNTPLRL